MGRSNTPRAERQIPPTAKTWTLFRFQSEPRRNKETKRTYPATVTRRMTGDVDDDGAVADRWPVSEFSVKAILDRWGPGRYRVDWYDNKEAKLGDWKFDVAEPAQRGASRTLSEEPDAEGEAMLSRLPSTPMGWLLWTQSREEAAARRRAEEAREERQRLREEADERAQRDRDFLREVAGSRALAAPAAAAPAADLSRELALMKRELSIQLREQNLQLRSEFAQREATLAAQAAAADDDNRPETATEALNSAGVEIVEALGEGLADIGPDILGAVRKWLRKQGMADTPEALEALIATAQAQLGQMNAAAANGAAHEPEEADA